MHTSRNAIFLPLLLCLLLNFAGQRVHGGDLLRFISARNAAMGHCSATMPGYANPAAAVLMQGRLIAFDYENRYCIKALSTYSLSGYFPNRYLDAGFHISRYGMTAYNENRLSANVYKRLNEHISLGIRVNYSFVQMAEADNIHAVTADAGLLLQPADGFRIGAFFLNPIRSGIVKGDKTEKLPQAAALGLAYEFPFSFTASCEVYKQSDCKPQCRFGLEYKPLEELSIRAGFSSAPFVPTAGIGLKLGHFDIDLAVSGQASLGLISTCGLAFRF